MFVFSFVIVVFVLLLSDVHFLDLVLEREYEVWVGRKVRRDLEVWGGQDHNILYHYFFNKKYPK